MAEGGEGESVGEKRKVKEGRESLSHTFFSFLIVRHP